MPTACAGGGIPLWIEEPTGVARKRWPVTGGVPFPRGELSSVDRLCLRDPESQAVPCQVKCLGTWPDGSVKWVLLHFQAEVDAQATIVYTLHYGPDVEPSALDEPTVSVRQRENQVIVDTGVLRFTMDKRRFNLFDQVWLNGRAMLWEEGSHVEIVDAEGGRFAPMYDEPPEMFVEEEGPLRAIVGFRGNHRTESGTRGLDYEVRLYAYAGLPWIQADYTFIHRQDSEWLSLKEVRIDVPLALSEDTKGLCGYYDALYESEEPFHLYVGTSPYSIGIFQHAEIHRSDGTLAAHPAHGWVDLSDASGGVMVACRHFFQNRPKRVDVKQDRISFHLWPQEYGELRFHQGWAKTHTLFFHFHEGDGRTAQVNEIAASFEDPLLLSSPDWFVNSGAMGEIFRYQPQKYPETEIHFRDGHTAYEGSSRAVGMIDWGDYASGGSEGRQRFMGNNELDFPHAMFLQFVRTGDRRYYLSGEAAARHTLDIDLVHHSTRSELEIGGWRAHGDQHVWYYDLVNRWFLYGGAKIGEISIDAGHMWTEGLLAYYYLSGDRRGLEAARGIGDCYLKFHEKGLCLSGDREGGWGLNALVPLYEATGDERYLDGARAIIEGVARQQKKDGSWDIAFGHYKAPSPMHVAILLTGMMRYHQATGEERVKEMFLKGARWMITKGKGRFEDGSFRYCLHPQYQHTRRGEHFRESLGYAYHLTGEEAFVRAALWQGKYAYPPGQAASGHGAALAADWRNALRFLYWADRTGVLEDPC